MSQSSSASARVSWSIPQVEELAPIVFAEDALVDVRPTFEVGDPFARAVVVVPYRVDPLHRRRHSVVALDARHRAQALHDLRQARGLDDAEHLVQVLVAR